MLIIGSDVQRRMSADRIEAVLVRHLHLIIILLVIERNGNHILFLVLGIGI